MATPTECFQQLLCAPSRMHFMEAKEALEHSLEQADILQLTLFRDFLSHQVRPELADDLANLSTYLDDLEEGSGTFPPFSQLKSLVQSREPQTMSSEEVETQRLVLIQQPLANLVKILNKMLWVQKFTKMRTLHKWFMLSISEYVEIIDHQEQPKDPHMDLMKGLILNSLQKAQAKKKPPSAVQAKTGARILAILARTRLSAWFHRWAATRPLSHSQECALRRIISIARLQLSQSLNRLRRNAKTFQTSKKYQELPTEDSLDTQPQGTPYWIQIVNCMCFQKTRPSFTLSNLDFTL